MTNSSEVKPANKHNALSKLECQKVLASYASELDYLQEKTCTEQPQSLVNGISVVARAHGISTLSRETGISRDGLYKAFSPTGNPSLATVMRVLKGLGYQLKIISRK